MKAIWKILILGFLSIFGFIGCQRIEEEVFLENYIVYSSSVLINDDENPNKENFSLEIQTEQSLKEQMGAVAKELISLYHFFSDSQEELQIWYTRIYFGEDSTIPLYEISEIRKKGDVAIVVLQRIGETTLESARLNDYLCSDYLFSIEEQVSKIQIEFKN